MTALAIWLALSLVTAPLLGAWLRRARRRKPLVDLPPLTPTWPEPARRRRAWR